MPSVPITPRQVSLRSSTRRDSVRGTRPPSSHSHRKSLPLSQYTDDGRPCSRKDRLSTVAMLSDDGASTTAHASHLRVRMSMAAVSHGRASVQPDLLLLFGTRQKISRRR